jgi:hypothetical protein
MIKSFAFLICLLVFVAAVDTVPDPPATSPRSRDGFAISAFNVHGPSTPQEKQWFGAGLLLRQISFHWVLFGLVCYGEPVGSGLPVLILHASDPSPPVFS